MSGVLPVLSFHHLGLATHSGEAASQFLSWMDYVCGPLVYDPEQNVHLRMCDKAGAPSVEIVTHGKGEGPLDQILRRYDQLIYHTCYEVADRDEAIEALESAGFRPVLVSAPKPAILFGGAKCVSFHMIPGFGLIELLDAK